MTPRTYAWYVYMHLSPLPDWRWLRAQDLVADDPHRGRFADDATTLRAVQVLRGEPDPALTDVRSAAGVYRAGGLRRALVEAYILTELTEPEIGERVGLSGATVVAYAEVCFDVRGDDPLSRFNKANAVRPGDQLRTAGVQWAPHGVWAVSKWLAGEEGLSPELMETFERRELLDRLHDTNPKAFLQAVERVRAIDAVLPPGVMHRPRLACRVSKKRLPS